MPRMNGPETIIGIVLAGGRSRRMGGGDKCLLPLAGRPLLAHVIERLKPQISELIVKASPFLRASVCRWSRIASVTTPVPWLGFSPD